MSHVDDGDHELDLTRCCPLDVYANTKKLRVEFLQELGVEEIEHAGQPAIRIPYHQLGGGVSRHRIRRALEKRKGKQDGRFLWGRSGTSCLYGLERLAIAGDEQLLIVEGESDAQTLWFNGVNALGVPGAGNYKPMRDDRDLCRFKRIIVMQEPDVAGERFVGGFLSSTHRRRISVAHLDGFKDVSEMHIADPALFEERLDAAIVKAVPLDEWVGKQKKSTSEAAAKPSPNPLNGLVERAASNAGAPFEPEVLQALVALKKSNRSAFEKLRAQLKNTDARVVELDKLIAQEGGENDNRLPTQADVLLELSGDAELFHAPDGTGYATIKINGHDETCAIRSTAFRQWLARRYFEDTRGAPSSEALQSTLNVIDAKARYDGVKRDVHVRVAELDGKLYLDLADDPWRAVEVDTNGWRVITSPPVRFRRPAGMQSLPEPAGGGSVEALRPFLNVKAEGDFVLAVAWLLATFRSGEPYPVLALYGEQGSAKSTFARILRALVDPNALPLRSLPRDEHDLVIAAHNAHVLAFDNVSSLKPEMADAMCRLATGGGFSTRQLYTDTDETLLDATRPIIINGIEDIIARPDLADRAIALTLEPIPEEGRQLERELWSKFEKERPRILGALLDALVYGLRALPETHLERLPRMADFARWATAFEGALWPAGTFASAYEENCARAAETALDADPLASAVRTLLTDGEPLWEGTATGLLHALNGVVGETVSKSRGWPRVPNVLPGRLRRAAPLLRKAGIHIQFDERTSHKRASLIRLDRRSRDAHTVSEADWVRKESAPSAPCAPADDTEGGAEGAQGAHKKPTQSAADKDVAQVEVDL